MKIQPIECPNCHATLKIDAGRKTPNGVYYCQYCGSAISIDDEVKRSEHTYRKIDEARILEAENERIRINHQRESEKMRLDYEREERKKKMIKKLIPFALIAVLVIFFSVRSAITNSRNEGIKEKVINIIVENDMAIDNISFDSDEVTVRIESGTFEKEKIDTVEERLIDFLKKYKLKRLNINFTSEYKIVRDTIVDEYGNIDHFIDNTNESSDNDRESIIQTYTKEVTKLYEKYPVELNGVDYEDDSVVLWTKTSTTYSDTLNTIEQDIAKLNNTLSKQKLHVVFTMTQGWVRETMISEEGEITIKQDKSNSYSDEKQKELIEEYKKAVSGVCKINFVSIYDAYLWENQVNIIILNTSKNKVRVDLLQKSLLAALKSHDSIDVKIDMCDDDNFVSIVRSILVNKEGDVTVLFDFTE